MTWIKVYDLESECDVAINLEHYPFMAEWIDECYEEGYPEVAICKGIHNYENCIKTSLTIDEILSKVNQQKGK